MSRRSRRRRLVPAFALALLVLAAPLVVGGGGRVAPGLAPGAETPGRAVPAGDGGQGVMRAGAGFFPLRPATLLAGVPLEAGQVWRFSVAGIPSGVPGEGVSAVALNAEIATGPSAATATIYPAGTPAARAPITVAAGPDGRASAFAVQRVPPGGELDVRADGGRLAVTVRLRGYYASPCGDSGGGWHPVGPAELVDTTLQPGASATAMVAGAAGVPAAGLQAATLSVDASAAGGTGRLQVHPSGPVAPDDATLAYAPGRDAGVLDVVRPGPDGRVVVTNRGQAAVRARVRVVGYHARDGGRDAARGSAYQAIRPSLLLATTVRAGAPVAVRVAGAGRLPAGGGDAIPDLAVVTTDPAASGRLSIVGAPSGQPFATVDLRAGEAAALAALPRPDPEGRVWLSVSAGSVRVRVWARGWFGAPAPLTAVPDPVTFSVFDRRGATEPGWTAGSVSAPVRLPGGDTAWLFGEAFVGILRPDGSQPPGTPGPPVGKGPVAAALHNTIVVQSGTRLVTRGGPVDKATGYPEALLRPAGAGDDRWYWPDNGVVEGRALRVFAHEFGRMAGGAIGWTGRNRLVSLSLPGMTVIADTRLPGGEQGSMVMWGGAVLEEARYTYVYGVRELAGGVKRTHVARFPRGAATGSWQFWDGTGWVGDPAAAVPLTGPAGADPITATPGTVARLGAGYVLLSIADLGATIDVRTSCSPVGPWSPARPLYQIPELRPPRNPGDYAFLARGYPADDGLLVAYSLNAADLSTIMRQASYYRPRYVAVR